MKTHTSNFKNELITFGREFDDIITYNGVALSTEDVKSVNYSFKSSLMKSVMKELKIDTTQEMARGDIIGYQLGLNINGTYEYLDYGNFIVEKIEKQEDQRSWLVTCYDKMLLTMVDYENLNISYPITIRDYISAICNHFNITFANANSTFVNYGKSIMNELYLSYDEGQQKWIGLGYTFRDVLDELAQVTGSFIVINENDELEVRYINDTEDTINEEFFNDKNVNIGEKYGPVNSLIFSRSADSDNIAITDDESIALNGLCEVKISDNQILNGNNRDEFQEELFNYLDGIYYYLNDYNLKGVLYYEPGDMYNVSIFGNTYQCLMLNDEINRNPGVSEIIYTEEPDESVTDYKTIGKTDRTQNQTTLIVDKQNQQISAVITNVGQQNTKISTLTQRVDNLESSISDIADLTVSGESSYAVVELDNVNESEPIMIKVRPILSNISNLYPRNNLYPSDDLYMTTRIIRFYNETTDENIDYEIPNNLLYYDSEHYDEFYLDYESNTCEIIKKCEYNADGSVSLLSEQVINTYTYPYIPLQDGNYTISVLGYSNAYIFTRLMSKNIYTSQFYTKAETNSLINQTASDIDLSVNSKLSNYSTTAQMNSAISLSASNITSSVSETYATKTTTNSLSSRINQTAKSIDLSVTDNGTSAGLNIKLKNEDGTQIDEENANITMSGLVKFTDLSGTGTTTINGSNITTGTIKSSNYVSGTSGTSINLSNGVIDSKNFKIDSSGNSTFKGTINGGKIIISGRFGESNPYIEIQDPDSSDRTPIGIGLWTTGVTAFDYSSSGDHPNAVIRTECGGGYAELSNSVVNAYGFNNVSLEERKKNFEKLENALEIIKQTDIYKFHYKGDNNDSKKHIGLVIGDKYNYSKELTNKENNAVDLYSMVGVCFKAIQEQQKEIEKLKEELKNAKN